MQNKLIDRICDLLRVLFDNILIRHFSLLHSGLIEQMKFKEEMEEFSTSMAYYLGKDESCMWQFFGVT